MYVDGDYWHSLPENAKRDKYNDDTLPKYNYLVFRIKEKDIKLGLPFVITTLEKIKSIMSNQVNNLA